MEGNNQISSFISARKEEIMTIPMKSIINQDPPSIQWNQTSALMIAQFTHPEIQPSLIL